MARVILSSLVLLVAVCMATEMLPPPVCFGGVTKYYCKEPPCHNRCNYHLCDLGQCCECEVCEDNWPGFCIDAIRTFDNGTTTFVGGCSCSEIKHTGWCDSQEYGQTLCRKTCGYCTDKGALLFDSNRGIQKPGFQQGFGQQVTCDPECENGGICIAPNICICTKLWTGPFCEIPMCDPSCENGGCTAPDTCTCEDGWTGAACEIATCDPSCENGNCTAPATCTCEDGWTGPTCNRAICDPSCENGGCTAPDTCTCEDGWKGAACEIECPVGSLVSYGKCYIIFKDKKRNWNDAKAKCVAEGYKMAARPHDAVALRKLLLDKYCDGRVWLDAHGDGSTMVWQNDMSRLANSNSLWWPGYPPSGDVNTDQCLYLVVGTSAMKSHPGHPYYPYPCSSTSRISEWPLYTLCEIRPRV